MSYKAQLITLEGIEGAGKSSVIPLLQKDMQKQGIDVLVTREPGGTELAEKIRTLLLEANSEAVDALTETLLMWAARRQHWLNAIEPALAAGTWVICDRFVDSSIAYQQYGRGIDAALIQQLHKETLQGFSPNLTLLFQITPEEGLARICKLGKRLDRIEQEKVDFFYRVAEGYQQLAKTYNKRFVVIESNKQQDLVISDARAALAQFVQAVRT